MELKIFENTHILVIRSELHLRFRLALHGTSSYRNIRLAALRFGVDYDYEIWEDCDRHNLVGSMLQVVIKILQS